MKFDPIDWKYYNRPPYLPQWLSTGETKKFTSYDDGHLIEIEGQIYNLSEQYDTEKAKSVLLDRIGRVLSEPRNGNDDSLYRLFIELRKLLNTTNGTVNDIIKVIKFLYSSEVVNITPNYPAALTILHDGEGPDIDFNRIIAQVIGAGIGYDTKEIFNFTDEVDPSEIDRKIVHRITSDSASQVILRNGRVFRDGKTVLDTQLENVLRDGSHQRDGTIKRYRTQRVPAVGTIFPPIYRRSGPQDFLSIGFNESNYIDRHKSQVFRNGAFVRDGTVDRSGYAIYSANDAISIDVIKVQHTDTLTFTDQIATNVSAFDEDSIGRGYQRNGKHLRNGVLRRASDRIVDPFTSNYADAPEADNLHISENLVAGLRHHFFRNGTRMRNGSIQRKGMVFIPLE